MTLTLDLKHLSASIALDDAPARRTLSSLSLAVAKSRKCIIVTGAGISCSCGIPDFRSSDGLYNLVKTRYPDVVLKGRDLFDSSLFRDAQSTQLFYTFMAELKASIDAAEPSATHHFLKALDGKGKLLRSYTQNIDGLEERVGLGNASASTSTGTGAGAGPSASAGPAKVGTKDGKEPGKRKPTLKGARNVQLHGNIHAVRCTLCAHQAAFTKDYLDSFRAGTAPECPACSSRCQARVARSARPVTVGTLRPAIVLYDEPHPLGEEIGAVQGADMARAPDLLIIMGTSLKVHGLKRLVKDFAGVVHSRPGAAATGSTPGKAPGGGARRPAQSALGKVIFVNRTPPSSEWAGVIDYHVQGETDAWVARVLDEWRRFRPQDWEVQTTLDDVPASVSVSIPRQPAFKVTKPVLAPLQIGNGKPSKPKAPVAPRPKPNLNPIGAEKKRPRPKRNGNGNGNTSDAENIPLSSQATASSGRTVVDISASSPPPSPGATVYGSGSRSPSPKPLPLSPSKRHSNASHDDPDASPRKKRSAEKLALGGKRGAGSAVFPEKGMLFPSPAKADKRGKNERAMEDVGLKLLSLDTPPKKRLPRRAKTVLGEAARA